MRELEYITMRDFFLSLSTLLDVAEPELSKHQLRTAFIAWQIGERMKLKDMELNELIIASLVHDIGALSLEEKVNLHSSVFEDLELHSVRGWYILNKVTGFKKIAEAVKYHHTNYIKLGDKQILAQIINLSDTVERLINRSKDILTQKNDIRRIIEAESNRMYNPIIISYYNELSEIDSFWFDLENPNMKDFFEDSPLSAARIGKELNLELSYLIRDVIDFKSPFTVRHSTSVMITAKYIAKKLKLTKCEIEKIGLAGLLHDIGKLVIPTSLIMKPGPLDTIERSVIKRHPYYTYVFLKSAKYPKDICDLASFHHETFRGNGYPFKIGRDSLTMGTRIISMADIFVALTEDRPYRQGLDKEKVIEIMGNYVKGTIDEDITRFLFENYEEILLEIEEAKKVLQEEYDKIMALKVEDFFD